MAKSETKMAISGWVFSCLVLSVQFACISCLRKDERDLMKGFQFRLPAAINPPLLYVQKEPNGSVIFRGSSVHLADYMAAAFDSTYIFVTLNATLLAKHGFTRLLIDMLLSGEINIVAFPMTLSWTRTAYMEFSYPLAMDPYKIMYPWPEEASRLLAPIRPYQTAVWILFLASLFTTTGLLSMMSSFWSKRNRVENPTDQRLGRNLIYTIAIALGQGDFLPYRNHSIRLAATGWCLMVVVLVNSYSSTLTSLLALPVYEKPINSFEDLAARTDVQLVLPSDSVLLRTMLEAQSGPYKIIGDSFRKNPDSIYKTINEGLRKLFSGKHCYTSPGLYIEYLVAEDYNANKKCRMTLSKSLTFSTPQAYGLPKNGAHNQVVDNLYIQLWDYGFIKHWMDMDRKPYEQCIVKPKIPRMTALKLKDLSSAFIVLLLGFGISIGVFVSEVFGFCIKKKLQARNRYIRE